MNLIDLHVKEVTSKPYEKYGKWWVNVIASAYCHDSAHQVMFNTREEAEAIKPGYIFQG